MLKITSDARRVNGSLTQPVPEVARPMSRKASTSSKSVASPSAETSGLFDVVAFDSEDEQSETLTRRLPLDAAVSYCRGFNDEPGRLTAAVVPSGSMAKPGAERNAKTSRKPKPTLVDEAKYRIVIVHNDGNVYVEPGVFDLDGANQFVEDFDSNEGVAWVALDREDEDAPRKGKIGKAFDKWMHRAAEANRSGLIENMTALARLSASLRQLAKDNCRPSDDDMQECFNDEGELDDDQFTVEWAVAECETRWPALDAILSSQPGENNRQRQWFRTSAKSRKKLQEGLEALEAIGFHHLNIMTGYFLYRHDWGPSISHGKRIYTTRAEAERVAKLMRQRGDVKVKVGRLSLCPMLYQKHPTRTTFQVRGMTKADNLTWKEFKQTADYARLRGDA